MESNWQTVSDSVFPWEQEALDFVRLGLPDEERVHAWSNFEIITRDGRIYEIDLLVVSPAGVFLVEIKSWPGRISGDAGTWTWTHDGGLRARDNPRVLANRKAKVLKSLLVAEKSMRKFSQVYVEALVFLSHPGVKKDLDPRADIGVHLRDREATAEQGPRRGILHALQNYGSVPRIDRPKAQALVRAMKELGVRPSRRSRCFGDHQLRELLKETEDYQEWRVEKESFAGLERRARLYPVSSSEPPESRQRRVRAARREFSFLQDLRHPGILWPVEWWEDERGPVLFFDYHAGAERLDHFLRKEHQRLGVDERLLILRQLFEAVAYAHERKLVHRALAPQAIEVESSGSALQVRIGDWHQGRRLNSSSRHGGAPMTATDHVGVLLDEPSQLYLAPETWTQEHVAEYDEPKLDIFSLGVVTYHLFTGAPPAADLRELQRKLQEGPGLQLSSVVDGAVSSLQELVAGATHPNVVHRIESVALLLEWLDVVEEELTEPDASAFADPRSARAEDELPGGFRVKKVLGSGATARVFRVVHGGGTAVLKVAHEREHNDRLIDEHEVLERLRHQWVVAPHGRVAVGERVGILMEEAGQTTLERRIAEHGALAPDELQRLGDELLQVVDHLEEKGIAHRDLKPANLGLRREEPHGRSHLVVFDFSLSRAPASRIHAGTVGYLDPFLKKVDRGHWDVQAERFSAAVILYEMATASRPVWGDGRSDPALVEDATPRVDSEQFPDLAPDTAERMAAFFARALAPELADRFDTCEEMLEAWRLAFASRIPVSQEPETQEEPVAVPAQPGSRMPSKPEPNPPSWAEAGVDETLEALELSKRALGALERAGARRVRDVLALDPAMLAGERNVGQKTWRELSRLRDALSERFPDLVSAAPPVVAAEEDGEAEALSLDQLFAGLVARSRRPAERQEEIVRLLLGLPARGDAAAPLGEWPSQTEVASALLVTRARVGQVVAGARSRWLKRLPGLTACRGQVAQVLAAHGGVMAVSELADALLFQRGSTCQGEERRWRSIAVLRAAVEAEAARDVPRYAAYRRPQGLFLALTGEGDLGRRLATFANQLGQRADQLAGEDPLPGSARALEALLAWTPPNGVEMWPDSRLLRLAAAASHHAALSSRSELYPRGLAAARAVSLAQGSLLGARNLSVEAVHRRILGRFPKVAPLPGRPELDALLLRAGTGLTWTPKDGGDEDGSYGPPELFRTLSTDTAHGLEEGPPAAELLRFEQRLQRAIRDHRFLVLTVAPRLAERAAEVLSERFDLPSKSLEQLLIESMRASAERLEADWDVVLEADAASRSSEDWALLLDLVRQHALPEVEAALGSESGTLILTRPGLLARYEVLAFFDRLRAATGKDLGAWVLVPGDPRSRPSIDGQILPVLGPGDWMPVPEAWLA